MKYRAWHSNGFFEEVNAKLKTKCLRSFTGVMSSALASGLGIGAALFFFHFPVCITFRSHTKRPIITTKISKFDPLHIKCQYTGLEDSFFTASYSVCRSWRSCRLRAQGCLGYDPRTGGDRDEPLEAGAQRLETWGGVRGRRGSGAHGRRQGGEEEEGGASEGLGNLQL